MSGKLRLVLVPAAVVALVSAVVVNRARGSADWSQLLLFSFGAAGLIASLPVVQRYLRVLMERSEAQSPSVRARFAHRPATALRYGLWFAAVVSLGEMAYWTYTKEVSGYRILSFHYMWQIPIGYLVMLLSVGALWWLIARATGRFVLQPLLLSLSLIGFAGWLFLMHELHELASLMLALGLAVQAARFAAAHAYLFDLLVRRTLAACLVLCVALAAGFAAWPLWTERRAIAALPRPASPAPNVLLIVLDTVRASSMSLYGYDRPTTPNLDRFAGRGVVFDRAFSTSPWTLPSHGSMFTGRLPHELSGDWLVPMDGTHPTLAEVLSGHGYMTAAFVSNTDYGGAEFGLGRGFIHYEDYRTTVGSALLRTSFGGEFIAAAGLKERFATHENFGRKSAGHVTGDFLGWLSRRDESRPFFAFLNYYDAHTPYLPPGEFAAAFEVEEGHDLWEKGLDEWSAEEIVELNRAYDATIAYQDHEIGRLLDELDRRGEMNDTIVILTSDHGEHFGEHGLLGHSNSLYPQLLHVPLLIVHRDRVPSGMRADSFVSLRDLPSTILEAIGLSDPVGFPGRSLSRHWRVPARQVRDTDPVFAEAHQVFDDVPASYPTVKGKLRSVITDGMQYIRNYGDGREELFDLIRDREAAQDLAASKPEDLVRPRSRLDQLP